MKNKTIILALALGLSGLANAGTVALQFTATNRAVNFANAGGTASAGLTFGIIVNQSGSGFGSASTDLFGTTLASTATAGTGILLSSGNYLFISQTQSSTLPPIPVFGAEAGATGSIGDITGVDTANIGNGDAFALVWFNTGIAAGSTLENGNNFGLFTDAAFVIPADGNTTDVSAPFAANPDPIRSANLSVVGVPEPSVAILGALGFLGLVRRRR